MWDLNARTGNQLDYIEGDGEIPLQFPFPYTIDQECPRVSKDSFVNTQGKCLLDLCISSGMRILNGRHEGDSNGELTCFTTNGSSVLDYVVASSEIMHIIEDFSINPLTLCSDHCPIMFSLSTNTSLPSPDIHEDTPFLTTYRQTGWNKRKN